MTDNEIKFAVSNYVRMAGEDVKGAICITSKDMIAISDLINRQQAEIQQITEKFNCQQTVYADLSKIIKDQKAEIESLNDSIQYGNEICENCQSDKDKGLKKAREKAIKEFAERLKKHSYFDRKDQRKVIAEVIIDHYLKRMVGEE